MTAKPPTARAVKQLIGRYEISYNEIATLCRTIWATDDLDVRTQANVLNDAAVTLFLRLHDLHDDLVHREQGQ